MNTGWCNSTARTIGVHVLKSKVHTSHPLKQSASSNALNLHGAGPETSPASIGPSGAGFRGWVWRSTSISRPLAYFSASKIFRAKPGMTAAGWAERVWLNCQS